MAAVVFVVSNDRHHPAMFAPVIAHLGRYDHLDRRVISLCEVRGLDSPTTAIATLGVPLQRALPIAVRKGSLARTVEASKNRPHRHRLLQNALWSIVLRPRLARLLTPPPELVVLPNDSAFPYNRLVRMLAASSVPYLLVQEGIRFPLPGVPRDQAYGRGGAAAIAAWGKSSASYFREIGVEADRIHQTGNPRFDQITPRDAPLGQPMTRPTQPRELLLVTNPIDDQGFCTKDEKLQLTRRFVDGTEGLIASGEIRLTLKLHAAESRHEYAAVLESSPVSSKLVFAEGTDLYPLLEAADSVVIMASTVGLEALLFGLPVGVLELPGAGFVFDYVSSEAAMGLTWSKPLTPQIRELLNYDPPGVAGFLRRHLSTSQRATENVARLIVEFAGIEASESKA